MGSCFAPTAVRYSAHQKCFGFGAKSWNEADGTEPMSPTRHSNFGDFPIRLDVVRPSTNTSPTRAPNPGVPLLRLHRPANGN